MEIYTARGDCGFITSRADADPIFTRETLAAFDAIRVFHFDTLHNDTALRSFPVDVIAVAGCKREKQQLAAVSA